MKRKPSSRGGQKAMIGANKFTALPPAFFLVFKKNVFPWPEKARQIDISIYNSVGSKKKLSCIL
jgi:hypothetical protein